VARQAAQTPKGRLRIDPVRHEHQATSTPQPGNGEVLQGELLGTMVISALTPRLRIEREESSATVPCENMLSI
jgi:FHA domain-containing protein